MSPPKKKQRTRQTRHPLPYWRDLPADLGSPRQRYIARHGLRAFRALSSTPASTSTRVSTPATTSLSSPPLLAPTPATTGLSSPPLLAPTPVGLSQYIDPALLSVSAERNSGSVQQQNYLSRLSDSSGTMGATRQQQATVTPTPAPGSTSVTVPASTPAPTSAPAFTQPSSLVWGMWSREQDLPDHPLPVTVFSSLEDSMSPLYVRSNLEAAQEAIGIAIETYRENLMRELQLRGTLFGLQVELPTFITRQTARSHIEHHSTYYFDRVQAEMAAQRFRLEVMPTLRDPFMGYMGPTDFDLEHARYRLHTRRQAPQNGNGNGATATAPTEQEEPEQQEQQPE
ncbi:uncharacterized protein F4822DRAFT_429087 [Hypoxylon trugodes]|uniref:uncharacterized protein n=1 Tax=Hypoxylon trugodes TaxID=326681 RepID=UPI00219D3F8A|nr:uncharacterized protein F4822DRAFT_429087 [Hypoxylon trugodes]KAI1388463.1 hypothetical protein F4822DRAFT_429087 [Hypoxylon trugodes]